MIQNVLFEPRSEELHELPIARDEFIFVVDRSQALKGEKLKHLKDILAKSIERLPTGSYFNIVSFVNKFHFYKFESAQLDEASRQEALEWIANLQEGSGSVLINNPVKVATTIPRKSGHLRTLILFTAHGLSHSDEMIGYMEENSKHVRFCHISLGAESFQNTHGDIQKAGRCMSTQVNSEQDAKEETEHLLELIGKPHIEGISFRLDCSGKSNHSVIHQDEAWNYLSNSHSLRYWFYLQPAEEISYCHGHLRFVEDSKKREVQYDFSIPKTTESRSSLWHKVAYSNLLRSLSLKEREAPQGGAKQMMVSHIVDLSTKYQIVSDYTALVLADEDKEMFLSRFSKLGKRVLKEKDFDEDAAKVLDKMFGTEEPEKVDSKEEEAKQMEENKKTDDMLMKFTVGICIVMVILFVLGKYFIKKYEADNALLQKEQERLEKEFYM